MHLWRKLDPSQRQGFQDAQDADDSMERNSSLEEARICSHDLHIFHYLVFLTLPKEICAFPVPDTNTLIDRVVDGTNLFQRVLSKVQLLKAVGLSSCYLQIVVLLCGIFLLVLLQLPSLC